MYRALMLVLSTAAVLPAANGPTMGNIVCDQRDIQPINAHVNYTTLLQFAIEQKPVASFTGDTERWVVERSQNLILIKPKVKGSKTNLHVVTASGYVCSFDLREVSDDRGTAPDLKVEVSTPSDGSGKTDQVWYSADDMNAARAAVADAQKTIEDQKANQAKELARVKEEARSHAEASIKHTYRWDQNGKAVEAIKLHGIYELDGFTVFDADPQEAPAIYEIKDGKPSLIQFELIDHKYTVPKILTDGYMRVGKAKLTFHREG